MLQTGTFPSEISWTKIVKENVYSIEEDLWRERLVNDDDFQLFRIKHPNIKPHKAWAVAKSFFSVWVECWISICKACQQKLV
jgi:hypothetical protein